MSEEIRPALSAEEWAAETALDIVPLSTSLQWAASEVGRDDAVSIPALAALALQHAGPDGGSMFHWHQVEWLREEARILRKGGARAGALCAEEIADTIASLLPPREQ